MAKKQQKKKKTPSNIDIVKNKITINKNCNVIRKKNKTIFRLTLSTDQNHRYIVIASIMREFSVVTEDSVETRFVF